MKTTTKSASALRIGVPRRLHDRLLLLQLTEFLIHQLDVRHLGLGGVGQLLGVVFSTVDGQRGHGGLHWFVGCLMGG